MQSSEPRAAVSRQHGLLTALRQTVGQHEMLECSAVREEGRGAEKEGEGRRGGREARRRGSKIEWCIGVLKGQGPRSHLVVTVEAQQHLHKGRVDALLRAREAVLARENKLLRGRARVVAAVQPGARLGAIASFQPVLWAGFGSIDRG